MAKCWSWGFYIPKGTPTVKKTKKKTKKNKTKKNKKTKKKTQKKKKCEKPTCHTIVFFTKYKQTQVP